MGESTRTRKTPGLVAAMIGLLAVAVYAAWALVQILILNPRAAVPGLELDQIHADVAAAGEDFGTALVVSTMMVGPLVMLALVVVAAVRPVPRMLPVLVGAAVLTVGPIAYWWASFGPGLALADTYLISGGDYSPWAWPLVAVSVAAFLTLITIGVTWVRRSLAPAATAPA